MTDSGPVPTGNTDDDVQLKGAFLPWAGDGPVLLSVPGSDLFYLPAFSTMEKMTEVMTQIETPMQGFKVVEDVPELMGGLPADVRIAFNPYFTPEGKVRWLEVTPEQNSKPSQEPGGLNDE